MHPENLPEIGGYLKQLWPKFDLNPEQAQVWLQHLRPVDVSVIRQAIANVYAEAKYATPKLSEVLDQIRTLTRGQQRNRGADSPQISPEHVRQIQTENARQDQALSVFSKTDLEACKAEILTKEPRMNWMRRLPVTNRFWKDAIEDRYLNQRVPYFVDTGSGQKQKRYMNVDEYWALCATHKKTPEAMAEILRLGI